jgi:hypothetical protein
MTKKVKKRRVSNSVRVRQSDNVVNFDPRIYYGVACPECGSSVKIFFEDGLQPCSCSERPILRDTTRTRSL